MTALLEAGVPASIAAAEAQAALAVGDTVRAQDKYAEAGALLDAEASTSTGEGQQLALFLAASQYYRGGHYPHALVRARKLQPAQVPAQVRSLVPQFQRDVEERASPDYVRRTRERLRQAWDDKAADELLAILREHPYVLPPANMAFLRAVCCEQLRNYRAAAVFFAAAVRGAPGDPGVLAALAPLPLLLTGQGKLAEAWEVVQAQVELFPNMVSHAVASLLCYQRAAEAKGNERTSLLREQARYFDLARQEFARLPASHQGHPEIRAVLGLGYEAAVYGLERSGDQVAAVEMCEAAIAFDPTSPNAWAAKGALLFDSPGSIAAFEKAVERGDRTYFPSYYLAFDAIRNRRYDDALRRSLEALERGGPRQTGVIKSLLYQWAAIARANLGHPREEAGHLFELATAADPDSEMARENHRRFLAAETPEPPPPAPQQEWQAFAAAELSGNGRLPALVPNGEYHPQVALMLAP